MEKQKAQAEGNQNLQITKALTTAKKEGEQAPDLAAAIGFNQLSDKLNDAPRQEDCVHLDNLVANISNTLGQMRGKNLC